MGHGIQELSLSKKKILMVGLSKSNANFSGMKPFGGPWLFLLTFSFSFFSYFGFYVLI